MPGWERSFLIESCLWAKCLRPSGADWNEPSFPRVPLHFTRGYKPWPLRGLRFRVMGHCSPVVRSDGMIVSGYLVMGEGLALASHPGINRTFDTSMVQDGRGWPVIEEDVCPYRTVPSSSV
jgi:hypothetical protein